MGRTANLCSRALDPANKNIWFCSGTGNGFGESKDDVFWYYISGLSNPKPSTNLAYLLTKDLVSWVSFLVVRAYLFILI
jgi:hypothetical protein